MDINRKWLRAAVIRAVKTMAQTAVAMIVADQAIYNIDWLNIVAVAATAGVCSIVTSLAGLPEAKE